MACPSREPEITTASDPPGSIEAELLPQHGESPLKFVDLGLCRSAVYGIDDQTGLAVKRLP